MQRLTKCFAFILLLCSSLAWADGLRSFTTSVVAADNTSVPQSATAISFHKLTWTTSGTVSTCTVAVDSSTDGTTWTAGGVITGQTCTSPGASTVVNTNVNFIRINVTAITGGGSVTAVWSGFVSNPSGGGGMTNAILTGGNSATAIPSGTQQLVANGLAPLVSSICSTMPRGGTVDKMFVVLSAAEGAAATLQLTMLKTGVAQTVTCTVGNNGTTCNDVAHSFTFAAGDCLAVQTVQTGTGTSQFIQVGIEYF